MFGMKKRAVRARLTESRLSAEVTAFIADVVRRTRLRRSEQIEVASELASHFAEGLAAGRTSDDLIRTYGDARTSARSLRQSAIAKRAPIDRAAGALLRYSSITTAALVVAYTGYATMLSFREPVVSFDAAAAVNARMPKPGAEGAAIDIYVSALSGDDGVSIIIDSANPPSALSSARVRIEEDLPRMEYDAEALARVREVLGLLAPRIEMLRKVKDHPVLGVAVATDGWPDRRVAKFFRVDTFYDASASSLFTGTLLSALLPQCAMLRGTAKLMCADATLAIHDGRTELFMDDIEAASIMATHAGESGFLINALVEAGTRQLVLGTIVSAIENHGERFDDAQLARLEALVRTGGIDLVRAFEAERFGIDDIIQRCYSDDGNGDGVMLAHAYTDFMREVAPMSAAVRVDGLGERVLLVTSFLGGPIAAHAMPGRREAMAWLDDHFDAMIAAARSPSRKEAFASMQAADHAFETNREKAGPVLGVMMPALGKSATTAWALRALQDTAAAAIGIERFRRANGRFPADRAELEKFLGWPLDANVHERASWRYALVDGRPLIYDIGVDGFDDRARAPLAVDAGPRDADGLPVHDVGSRMVSLSSATADRRETIGASSARSASAIAVDAPLDPTQPVSDVDPHATGSEDGDHVRVWWKSGAAGWTRVVPARAPAGEVTSER
ncbi:MAG: hypothetical protein LW806_04125 [Planctomycetaceae bacterium]|nr:hypothetical protein [Planctomycetaceae bacterium]